VKALWYQLKEDYKSKVKLNVWALRNEMSVVKLSICENVQEYTSKIQSYVNDFNLCAETNRSTGHGTMLKSEHTYYDMKGKPKDDDWMFFTQLMYDKIDSLADKPEEIVTKM
jgi:transcription initiation factor IIF auxiliary subunit